MCTHGLYLGKTKSKISLFIEIEIIVLKLHFNVVVVVWQWIEFGSFGIEFFEYSLMMIIIFCKSNRFI